MTRHDLKFMFASILSALLILVHGQSHAIIITYSNPGPTDSVVYGGFNNIVQVGQPGFFTTSDFIGHNNVIARFDTAIGHGIFPIIESTATAQVEIGTNLNSPTGTGVRSVFSPITNASFLAARGQTYQPGPLGNYSSQSFVHSGNLSTTTTPTSWIISVLPSVGEVAGTPVDVTIDANILGLLSVAGASSADATWLVTTTLHGGVMAGTQSQSTAGTSVVMDSGILTFTIPLGTTFELLVDYEMNTAGSGAGANSFAEISASLVDISAVFTPPVAPMFLANFGNPLGDDTTSTQPAGPWQQNRTIPLKFELFDEDGNRVSGEQSESLDVRVALYYDQPQGSGAPTPTAANPPGHGTPVTANTKGTFHLNLNTNSSGWLPDYSYQVVIEVDGEPAGEAFFSLR